MFCVIAELRRVFPSGATLFAFYEAYPQKRITAEIELIDKRNVQTYVDRAVVRPLTIPSGAQIPLLAQTARDLLQPKLCAISRWRADALNLGRAAVASASF
jgi:hypothetical protein